MPEPSIFPHERCRRSDDREALIARFREIRQATEALAEGLTDEDQVVQSMPDASPVKWHLAHTAWFFEIFLLTPEIAGYRPFHPQFGFLFNSYYEAAGPRHPRPDRGLLTRPSVPEVAAYRRHVSAAMAALLETAAPAVRERIAPLVELGLHHEQQHQELILTDLLHLFSCNPLRPAYRPFRPAPARPAAAPPWVAPPWVAYAGGIHAIGHDAAGPAAGFAFDNESPRHQVLVRPFRLAGRAVTNAEWQAFIADGGYRRPALWLSDGWAVVQQQGWQAPSYWEREGGGDGDWRTMTLSGMQPVDADAPVCHISYFEADAFARWTGKRLPTEAEWEIAAASVAPAGNTAGSGLLRPLPAVGPEPGAGAGPRQLFGDVWEWTASPFTPYPGFVPAAGAVGEYNGKFMCQQYVLRGGSCVTPDGHVRATYRNFFYPHQRWQFTGLRLAEDA